MNFVDLPDISSTSQPRENKTLLDWIMRFEIGTHEMSPTFAEFVARENGWSEGYTRRVIDEYKKFAYLACVSGRELIPSDEVDQVWRAHMADSRDYWEAFCSQVLERAWHRKPLVPGKPGEAVGHETYAQTLQAYRDVFDTEPPADIWPPAVIRFGYAPHFTRVNLALFRLQPRQRPLTADPVIARPLYAAAAALSFAGLFIFYFMRHGGGLFARVIDSLVVTALSTTLIAAALTIAAVYLPRLFRAAASAKGERIEQERHGFTITFDGTGPDRVKAAGDDGGVIRE